MKNNILLMGSLIASVMERLDDTYTVHRYYEADDKTALLSSIASVITAVVTDGGTGINDDVLAQLPNVQVVTVYGVGVDAVALQYCKENKIKVTNTPDVLSDDVADMGVALMLAVSRQLAVGDRYCRAGRWPTEGAMPLTTRMTGKRAGIFGMGSIGLRLANRLEAFDMDVSYCNRTKRSDVKFRYYNELNAMAREVDYLIVAASASPATAKIIDATVLEEIGSAGYLINISRGTLVDEGALISALKSGAIKGAGLDVFENEPQIPEALIAMDNVVLYPHHSSGTTETRKAMGQVVLENLTCHFEERPLKTEYYIS